MSAIYKKRFEVAFLACHPKGPKMTVNAIAKYTKTSKSFAEKWIDRYKRLGHVDELPNRGKTRSTTKSEDKAIVRVFEKNPEITLTKAKEKLSKKGICVSLSTIRNRLSESGIKNRSTMPKPLLTEFHKEKRLKWARENVGRDWSNIIFTDESSFVIQNCLRRAWTKKGEKFIQRTVKHPAKVHVYGSFSQKGFGKLMIFTGILTAERMIHLYQNGLLESAKMLYGENNNDWLLQEDNDPKHRSRLCTEWKQQKGINVMSWPSQSPDANPIENVWALMKHRLCRKEVKGVRSLKRHLKKIWKELTVDYAEKLVESCERRCQQIIDNNGDWTIY